MNLALNNILLFATDIPGLKDWLTDEGSAEILTLHDKMMETAWYIFGIMVIISAGLALTGLLTSMEVSAQEVAAKGIMVVVLLLGFDFIFAGIFNAGRVVADRVMSYDDIQSLTDDVRERAKADQEGAEEGSAGNWLGTISNVLWNSIINPGMGLSMIMIGLSIALFLFGWLFMTYAFLALAIASYVFSPIVIALGVIPRWGGRLMENWVSSIVQLSAWQIWMAICTWFVKLGPLLFLKDAGNGGPLDTTNTRVMIESAAMCLVFAAMIFATPWVVNALLPISHFGYYANMAMNVTTGKITGAVTTAAQVATMGAGGGAGGGGGAMAGASAGGSVGGGGQALNQGPANALPAMAPGGGGGAPGTP